MRVKHKILFIRSIGKNRWCEPLVSAINFKALKITQCFCEWIIYAYYSYVQFSHMRLLHLLNGHFNETFIIFRHVKLRILFTHENTTEDIDINNIVFRFMHMFSQHRRNFTIIIYIEKKTHFIFHYRIWCDKSIDYLNRINWKIATKR